MTLVERLIREHKVATIPDPRLPIRRPARSESHTARSSRGWWKGVGRLVR